MSVEGFIFKRPITVEALDLDSYASNGALAVVAIIKFYGRVTTERVTISCNVPPHSDDLPPGEFFAKNYSEGEPLYNILLTNGVIEQTGKTVKSGFVTMPACRLTNKGKAMLRKRETFDTLLEKIHALRLEKLAANRRS